MLREKGIPARSLKGGYTGWLFQQMQKESKKGDSEETENEAMEQRRKDIELSCFPDSPEGSMTMNW